MIAVDRPTYVPSAPKTVEETGLSNDVILQLVTKTLHLAGDLTGIELASRLGVTFPVVEAALEMLKRERQC